METESFASLRDHYKIFVGSWINQNTPVLVTIGFEKNVEDNKILIETYILIPKNGYELLDDEPMRTNLPSSFISEDIFREDINIVTCRIESELQKIIPPNKRGYYSDLFPYKLDEIEVSKLMGYYNVINHENLAQEFLSCLERIEQETHCNILRDQLSNLRRNL